ncbi:AAA family ATPase [Roseibium aggregatum]|uniref:ATPase AAA-type core domain-containing protein n=1 Tax=Roseibium aggregatum TaxID=187304 RepID=A0A0M6Y3V3_9HYPH|nr:AAA family ATPase [Roseibium aggregatum]CTQ44782.1 hypothetical protein LAL4801_03229 [Roseibium aggregatum]
MSQLLHFSLENYKAFNARANIQIRPLTLFFGYNSAGKSAALRFLKLLSDSVSSDSSSPLNLRSEVLNRADFASLLSKHSSSLRLNIALDFGNTSVAFTILDLPDRRKQVLEKLEVHQIQSESPFVFEWLPDTEPASSSSETYAFSSVDTEAEVELSFDGLVPRSYPDDLIKLLKPIATSLEAFGKSFVSLSADCALPERYELEVAPAKTVSRRGEGIMSMLQAAPMEVIQDISRWYEAATNYSFQRNRITIGDKSGHRFTLHPNADDSIDIDIIDTGEGMGQVLPVVGLLTLAKHGTLGNRPIISLEHPELHIHPDAHVHLANISCEVATSKEKPRILIETHSENLLLGVQLAIAEQRIKPSDVAVHWVRGTENGAIIELVEFDDQARPVKDNWPIDVFRTNSKLARGLFEKRKAM